MRVLSGERGRSGGSVVAGAALAEPSASCERCERNVGRGRLARREGEASEGAPSLDDVGLAVPALAEGEAALGEVPVGKSERLVGVGNPVMLYSREAAVGLWECNERVAVEVHRVQPKRVDLTCRLAWQALNIYTAALDRSHPTQWYLFKCVNRCSTMHQHAQCVSNQNSQLKERRAEGAEC